MRPGRSDAGDVCGEEVDAVSGWNGRRMVGPDMESPHAATRQRAQAPLAANAAGLLDLIDVSPVFTSRRRVRRRRKDPHPRSSASQQIRQRRGARLGWHVRWRT